MNPSQIVIIVVLVLILLFAILSYSKVKGFTKPEASPVGRFGAGRASFTGCKTCKKVQ